MTRKYVTVPVLRDGKKETKEIWLDGYLKTVLDSVVYNIKMNPQGKWDTMIIISGDRLVGTGKSTVGALVGSYLAFRLGTSYTIDDIYFDSEELIDMATKKPKFSIDHYDEARRGLASTKRMQKVQEDLVDYFTECRQLRHVTILVLPDFFSLNEEIAVARSECLINVYRGEKNLYKDIYKEGEQIPIVAWDRGYLTFFNRKQKAKLYDTYRNTRKKSYHASPCSFNAEYKEFEILGEEYEDKKLEALKKYQSKKKLGDKEKKLTEFRNKIILKLSEQGKSTREIAKHLNEEYGYDMSHMLAYEVIKKSREDVNPREISL